VTHTLAALPPLPPGFEYAPAPAVPPYAAPHPAQPDPPRRPSGAPVSGPITTVTSASGTTVTIHRCDYQQTDHLGEYTVYGHMWRCTSCHVLSDGYEPTEFAHCLSNARDHHCGTRHG
jgi:hypothetical protein